METTIDYSLERWVGEVGYWMEPISFYWVEAKTYIKEFDIVVEGSSERVEGKPPLEKINAMRESAKEALLNSVEKTLRSREEDSAIEEALASEVVILKG